MKSFEYGDQEIGEKEIMFSVPSLVIAIMMLTIPRIIADTTNSFDGWITICAAGIISIFFIWLMAKLGARFPKQSFFEYTSLIATKPVAYLLTTTIAINYIIITAYEVRMIGEIAREYLFVQTPKEFISLMFFLVVIYAVAGLRVAVLRLNLLFIPIIITVLFFLAVMSLPFAEIGNVKPLFIIDGPTFLNGLRESTMAFVTFEGLLFYIAFMNKPKKAPKAVVIGMSITLFFYLFTFISVVSVLGVDVSKKMIYPTIELATTIVIPGEVFERFEVVFFTIWIMMIYTTALMAFDISLMALESMFKKMKKLTFIFSLSPFIFILAFLPKNILEVFSYSEIIGYISLPMGFLVPGCLLVIAKLRNIGGRNSEGKNEVNLD